LDSQEVDGKDVYHVESGKVRAEWLSRCRDERALTAEMMSEVIDLSNLVAALQRVKRNKGSAGIDGMDISGLMEWFNKDRNKLINQLEEGRYHISPIRGLKIPKPKGGERQLGIPTVKDRLVQQAISQILSRHYDKSFSKHSHGFALVEGHIVV